MSCEHDCVQPPVFPATIFNRPAQDRIGYRIGDYARFRAHSLARLDHQLALDSWTHRGADDPGIALLECGAIAAEILAFYQELYANEAYLRTADWRESVARLVALSGYRLAPGLGGEVVFALAVSGERPVAVPAGFPFKADLDELEQPAKFESTEEVVCYPWLNQFSLYRKRLGPKVIAQGDSVLELRAVAGDPALGARQAVEFNPGDRIMLVPDSSMFEAGGTFTVQSRSEILVVDRVETVLDRIAIHFEGAVTVNRGPAVRAYKIGRSFRHFGHNAPIRLTALNEVTGRAVFEDSVFDRKTGTSAELYSQFADNEVAFDADVSDLPAGTGMIVSGAAEFASVSGEVEFAVVNQVDTVRKDASRWAGLAGGSTAVSLKSNLFTNGSLTLSALDIRRLQAHEALSPPLTLAAASNWQDGAFGFETELTFFGTFDQAVVLASRSLLLEDADGITQTVTVDSTVEEFDLAGRDPEALWLWSIRLDQPPRYDREAFDEIDNTITIYGNLVLADQGETQKEAAIGSGDARQAFQTFKLPKAPLTYLLHNAHTPPEVPELGVYVDGALWNRVDTFFDSGPNDRVYVIREDDAGDSHVQFGDGKTGARLPSGRQNVMVRYRIGTGARGPLNPDAAPKAMGRLKQLSEVSMPAPAFNGAAAESEENGREAAPLRMQALGRLVGLSDYEAEALTLPGVQRARATWVAPNGFPRLRIIVLTDGGTEVEAAAVANALNAANRCRGAARFPIETVQGNRRYVHLDLTAGYAADRLPEDIEPEIRAALGVAVGTDESDDGLFGFKQRQFGQDSHVSQVIGLVQQIDGVSWVRVDAFQAVSLGRLAQADPVALPLPAVNVRHEAIACAAESILALHEQHLVLNLAIVADAEECA